MTIDQQASAEPFPSRAYQVSEFKVVGQVTSLNPPTRLGKAKCCFVNFVAVSDDTGNGSEPGGNARRLSSHMVWQLIGKHLCVEFIRLAVDIDIGAREMGPQQRRAKLRRSSKDLVDEGVLGAPQRGPVEI